MTKPDKIHIIACFIVTYIVGLYGKFGLNFISLFALFMGASAGLVIGMIKELLDEIIKEIVHLIPPKIYKILKKISLSGTGFSLEDIYCDVLGIVWGVIALVITFVLTGV